MNVFNLELYKIQKQFYKIVENNETASLIIPLGDKQELKIFEAFFQYQLAEDVDSEDVFLFQQQPFIDKESYGASLVEEWSTFYRDSSDDISNLPAWNWEQSLDKVQIGTFKTDAYKAFYALQLLYEVHPNIEDKYVFVQLAYIDLSVLSELNLWIAEWCQLAKEEKRFKLVVTDHVLHRVITENKSTVSYPLEVDIQKIMESAATETNEERGGSLEGEYKQQLILASRYLEKKETNLTIVSFDKAIDLAKKMKMPTAEVSALIMKAEAYASVKKKAKAKECFEAAFSKDLGSFFYCQLGLIYGSFLYSISEKKLAKVQFEKVIELAEEKNEYSIAMESHRMLGQLNKSFLNSSSYVEHLEKALEFGRKLPKDIQLSSSMPYVSSMLIKEYGKDSGRSEALDQEMIELFSSNWQENVQAPKMVKRI